MVRAGDEGGGIVNAGELADPDRLAVGVIVVVLVGQDRTAPVETRPKEMHQIERRAKEPKGSKGISERERKAHDIRLDTIHTVLVDVNVGDIKVSGDELLERLQPARLGRLVAHGRRHEDRPLDSPRSDEGIPQGRGGRVVHPG